MTGIIGAIFGIFTSIGVWMVETLPTFFALFYVQETGLTLLGTLAVCSLGISIVFLLVGIIQRFMKFRG